MKRNNMKSIKLRTIAESVVFQNQIHEILFELSNTPAALTEDESENLSPEEEKALTNLMNTFAKQLTAAASEVKATAKDSEELKDIIKQNPELKPLQKAVEEAFAASGKGKINEAIGMLIAGIVAALPKLIEIFGKLTSGIGGFLNSVGFKKGGDKVKQFATKIATAGKDLHHKYIHIIEKALGLMIPSFKNLDSKMQHFVAESVYIAIVALLGYQAGVGVVDAFSKSNWALVGVEGLMAAIKSGEVGQWIATVTAKAVAAAAA